MFTLKINNHEFDLPKYCDVQYMPDSKTTHVFFDTAHVFFDTDKEQEYTDVVDKICKKLGIERFGHKLGIVFSYCHIFWDGVQPPVGVSVIWTSDDGKKRVTTLGQKQ